MIKASLIVLCGLVVARLLRKRSAAMRHWVLTVAIGCAAAVPVLEQIAPGWNLRPATSSSAQRIEQTVVATAVQIRPLELDSASDLRPHQLVDRIRTATVSFVRPLWLIGVGISVFVLLVGLGRLTWLASRSEQIRDGKWIQRAEEISRAYGLRRPIVLLLSNHPTLLVTWGVMRPKIILPTGARDWPDDRLRIVLAHEFAHIRRADWPVQMIAELLRSAYWFNPLLWIACRQLRQESEQACDDAVLNLGVEGPEYATHLLDLAREVTNHRRSTFPVFPAPAMVRPSSLERRVSAMLNTRLNRNPASRSAGVVTTLGLLAVTILICGFGAVAQSFATFSGSVVDPMNTVIPKVTLVLTNVQNQAKHEVRSDDTGRFEFVGLPPGDYLLDVRFPGFATLTGSVTVAGQDVHRTLALQIGSLQETITVRAAPGSASRDQPIAEQPRARRNLDACSASATGGNIRPPAKLKDVRPVYPRHLSDARVTGVVVLDGRIGVDGSIRELTVRDPANPDLATAAFEAVRQWQFDSTLLNCVPVEVAIKITVNFEVE